MPVPSGTDDTLYPDIDPLSVGGPNYFPGAHSFTVKDTRFTHIHGDYNITHEPHFGLANLERHISHDAMFDSAARYSAGQCHPGTRTAIIKEICDWIHNPRPESDVFWVHGSAGVGKSALMQTIAQLLHEANNGRYAGSYFFAHGIAGCQEDTYIFPTLAYQVAVNLPAMRPLIEAALQGDPSLPTKSKPSQIKSLLVNPFKKSHIAFCQHTPTVIIDGLDECEGSSNQLQILSCIANALASGVPLRFLIASRPEHWIKHVFSREPLSSVSRSLSLNDKFTSQEAHSDIRMYLQDGFADICALYSDVIGHSNSDSTPPWPSPDVIGSLVENASGQFIYASTVLKFVGHSADFCDPRFQLDIVLGNNTEDSSLRATAFSEVDRLYMRILLAYPRQQNLKKVLAGLLLNLGYPLVFQALLGVELSEVFMILNFLSSVLRVTEHAIPVGIDEDLFEVIPPRKLRTSASFIHKSMKDFLLDPERSGEFTVDAHRVVEELWTTFMGATVSCLKEGSFAPNEVYNKMEVYNKLESILEEYPPNYLEMDPNPITLLSDLHLLLQTYTGSNAEGPGSIIHRPDIFLGSLRCIDCIAADILYHHENPYLRSLCVFLSDKCFPKVIEQMLEAGHLLIKESLVYFVFGNPFYGTYLPGIPPKTASSFLINTPNPLIVAKLQIVSPPISWDAVEENRITFHLLPEIKFFFEKQISGEHLRKFRAVCSDVCQAGLVYITNEASASSPDRSRETICTVMDNLVKFFKNPSLSDLTVGTLDEIPAFRMVLDSILGLQWTHHSTPETWPFINRLSVALMAWRRRHIERDDFTDVLMHCDQDLSQKFQHLPTRLFDAVLLPAVTVPLRSMFPELFSIPLGPDGEVDLQAQPPHIIDPHCSPAAFTFPLRFSAHNIFSVLQYLPGYLGIRIITHAAEFYLNLWAYRLYYSLVDSHCHHAHSGLEYDTLAPELLMIHCEDIYPTRMILRTLRVTRYLCKQEQSRGPFLFCRGFREWVSCILKKYTGLSSTEMDEFRRWITALKEVDMDHSMNMLSKPDEINGNEIGEEVYYDFEE